MKHLFILGLTTLLLVGCSSTLDNEQEVLNIYSARHYDVDKDIIESFEAEYNIDVNVIEGKGDELLERLIFEKQQPQADLYITVGAETLSAALSEEVFAPMNLEAYQGVLDESYYGEEWVALTKRARVFVYEENKGAPVIETYDDILDEQFKGKFLVRSATSSYNIALLASMIQQEGIEKAKQWAEGAALNFAKTPSGNDRDQARSVMAQVGEVALMNTYYLILMENSSDPADQAVAQSLGIVFPEKTHMNISYAAILKGAKNKDNAQLFVNYLLETQQQEIYMNDNGEFPVRSDVMLNRTMSSWGEFDVGPVDYETLGDYYAQAVIVFDQAQWD